MTEESQYEMGLRDGRIQSLEAVVQSHEEQLSHVERRLQLVEKIAYAILGATALIQLMPTLNKMLGVG